VFLDTEEAVRYFLENIGGRAKILEYDFSEIVKRYSRVM
jgi:hypothetical protein